MGGSGSGSGSGSGVGRGKSSLIWTGDKKFPLVGWVGGEATGMIAVIGGRWGVGRISLRGTSDKSSTTKLFTNGERNEVTTNDGGAEEFGCSVKCYIWVPKKRGGDGERQRLRLISIGCRKAGPASGGFMHSFSFMHSRNR